MSIIIQNQEIGNTTLINPPENEIQEIDFTATDLNEANNVLSVSLDETVTLRNNTVYCFVVDCDEFTPDVGTKIHFTDFDETIENVYGYYNSVENAYKFFVLHKNDANEISADVTTVIRVSGAHGTPLPVYDGTSEEIQED